VKIGLIGVRGFVGSSIAKKCSEHEWDVEPIHPDSPKAEFDVLINANGNSKKYLAEKDPFLDFEKNVIATTKYLEKYRDSFGKYVHISSGEIYGKMGVEQSAEEASADGFSTSLSNYGFSKVVAEQFITRHISESLIVRLGGQIGPQQSKGPIYDLLNGVKLRVHPKSTFQFMRTESTAEMLVKLIDLDATGVFNIASTQPISIMEIAQKFGFTPEYYENSKEYRSNMSIHKLQRVMPVPTCETEVEFFLREINQ
jgi:nucleoside-diphosphate-sugar epimerase